MNWTEQDLSGSSYYFKEGKTWGNGTCMILV
jgi:hypothetical protein